MDDRDRKEAPEAYNREQADEGQAQDVAEEALHLASAPGEDSEHGGRSNPAQIIPDDAEDVVDHMKQMVSSGVIDNSAYDGEPDHDDEAEDDD